MSKVIIGIHGLANKPEKEILADWWETSIREGLSKNCGVVDAKFEFKMVYWADLLYHYQLHDDENFSFDKLYNDEPYEEAAEGEIEEHEDGITDSIIAGLLGFAGVTIDFAKEHLGMEKLADWVLGKVLKDLAFYYNEDQKIGDRSTPPKLLMARKVLQDELRSALQGHQDDEIMLIAHSMGSIIAYDVLRDIGQENSEFKLSSFVTIGSPLGLPHVKDKIMDERTYDADESKRVRTPSVVTGSWVNYADRKDPVALDVHLRDDYGANARGVRVLDDLVNNGYRNKERKPNYHKSYGYLRTPELSRHIDAFL